MKYNGESTIRSLTDILILGLQGPVKEDYGIVVSISQFVVDSWSKACPTVVSNDRFH